MRRTMRQFQLIGRGMRMLGKWLRRVLYRYTATRPCRIIRIEGRPYMERYFVATVGRYTVYLHRFLNADDERYVHDHPWACARALILCGGYCEERLLYCDPVAGWASRLRRFFPGRINTIKARDFHRLTSMQPETWTLFWHTPRCKRWGFLQQTDAGTLHVADPVPPGIATWWGSAPRGDASGREPLPCMRQH